MSNLKPSEILVKTQLVAGITPLNDNSNFPTHYADFGYGGLRSVVDLNNRNLIPNARRDQGMLVFVISEDKYYRLENGITNADWVELRIKNANDIGLSVETFVIADWTETNAPNNAIVVDINHGLNEQNITVDWYEDGIDGNVFVPWETLNLNSIRGCIPKGTFDTMTSNTGNAFGGFIRITTFIQPENSSNLEGHFQEFNNQTSGTGADWTETGMDTGIFELDITHGLNSNSIDYLLYLDNGCPVLICPTLITLTRITFQVPEATVFGGRVFITKVTG